MFRASLVVFLAVLFAGAVSATPVVGCADGTGDVLSLNPMGCELGPLAFSNFEVGSTLVPDMKVGISSGSNFTGSTVNLLFTLNQPTVPSDTTLLYKVTGPMFGVDMALGTYSGDVSIIENACTVSPTLNSNCIAQVGGTSLAAFFVDSGGPTSVAVAFAEQNEVWIKKDITIGDGGSMSDFNNSHATVPEPSTYMLIGAGLFGLACWRRRKSAS